MKDFHEIQKRLKAELDQWFIRQCRNVYDDYYLYYLATTAEHNGGIIICKEPPANNDYKLADNQRINKGQTVEANFCWLSDICRKLPILSIS